MANPCQLGEVGPRGGQRGAPERQRWALEPKQRGTPMVNPCQLVEVGPRGGQRGALEPQQRGTPMVNPCQLGEDELGNKLDWGRLKYTDLYGSKGWCNVDLGTKADATCGCSLDGIDGEYCQIMKEGFCPNQCSGLGECVYGFCKCYEGWYGTDCARKKAGLPMEPSNIGTARPRLAASAKLPRVMLDPQRQPAREQESKDRAVKTTRKRPFIYVYDIPAEYNTRMLEYKHQGTLDPEGANFFCVPIYLTYNRPMHAANMMLEVKRWLEKTHPWWKRRQGRDHIWLMAHDEVCVYVSISLAPSEISNTYSMLSHWGRMELHHTSASGWPPDNYSRPLVWPGYQDEDWRNVYLDSPHPCFDPKKDLLIPAFKSPSHFTKSPLMGARPVKRDILLFFRGDVGLHREKWYGRRIRQTLYQLAQEEKWREKHNIFIGTGANYEGDYGDYLVRSKFCLVAPGKSS
eukprot:gene12371-15556_t